MPNTTPEDPPPPEPMMSPAPSPWPIRRMPTPEPRCIAPLYQDHDEHEARSFGVGFPLARAGVVLASALLAGSMNRERSGPLAWLLGVASVALVVPYVRSFWGAEPEAVEDDPGFSSSDDDEDTMKERVDHEGVVPYRHKVGGHQSDDGLDVCVLVGEDKEVLKRMQPLPYLLTELSFYGTDLPAQRDTVLAPILKYLPEYYGALDVGAMRYLRLENLMRGYQKPCILDMKIGQRCYETAAPPDKKGREKKKYPHQEVVGFRATGLKVWKPAENQYFELIRHSKKRTLEEFWGGRDLELFLEGQDRATKLRILETYREHLAEIQAWFETQTYFELCAVSLLFAYEGDPDVVGEERMKPMVWLVDFAHVLTDTGVLDENFLFGIRNFRKVVDTVADKVDQGMEA